MPGSELDGGNAEMRKLQEAAGPPALVCRGLFRGKLGSWRMGSPWHISWLGEPMRQLAAAPPDITLLSWEHGSFLFKNKKYF